MNKRIKVFLIVLFGFVSVGFSFMHAISNVAASSLTDGLIYKATYQGVYRCYKNGYVKSSFPVSDYSSIGSLIKKDSGSGYVALVTGAKTSSYNVGDSNLTCKELFKGGMYGAGISGSNDDLLTANGKKAPSVSNTEKVNELLKNMGYTIKEASGDGASCFYLPYTAKMKNGSTNKGNTNKLCKKNGTFYTEGRKLASAKAERKPTFVVKSGQVCLYLPSTSNAHGGANAGELCRSSSEVKMTKNGVRDFVVGICKNGGRCVTSVGDFIFDAGAPAKKTTSGSAFNAKFKTDGKTAGKTAVKYLSDGMYNNAGVDKKGISLPKSFAVSRLEKRMLYQWYLKNYYNMDVVCDKKQSAAAYDAEVYWLKSGKSKPEKCHVDKGKIKHKEQPVNGVDGSGFFRNHSISGPDALISELNKMKDDEYSDEELKSLKDLKEQAEEKKGTETTSADGDVCYEGSGALGWIICPVVEMVSNVGNSMWSYVEKNFLQVPVSKTFESNGGVEQTWKAVRDIANTIFVIFFLFVIFSQLTGIGIDNYGIKKTLPKIIVVAILVNLSFLICVLAVDLSNILGNGLENLLSSNAGALVTDSSEMNASSKAGAWLTGAALAGGGAAIFVAMNGLTLLAAAASVGIAVLGFVITVVVSIFVLYLILIIREAGIILLVALSPAALVCYMLPNTEKIYKRWFDLFKALLLVYPICGAMIGAGKLAGSVLASINSEDMRLAAMIVQVVPFFLIPLALKSSMALLGNVGSRLSSFGQTMGRRASTGTQNAIKNSDRFKSWSGYQDRIAKNRKARGVQARLLDKMGRNGGHLSENDQRRLREADDIVTSNRQETLANEASMNRDNYNAGIANVEESYALQQRKNRNALMMQAHRDESLDQLSGEWEYARSHGNMGDVGALTETIFQLYGTRGVNRIARNVAGIGTNDAHFDATINTLRQSMNDNSSLASNIRERTGDLGDMISNNGRIDGERATLGQFSGRLGSADSAITSDKDLAGLTGATLRRAVENDAISTERMHNLLTSNDPAILASFQGDPEKRRVIEDAYVAATGDVSVTRESQRQRAEQHEQDLGRIADNLESLVNSTKK